MDKPAPREFYDVDEIDKFIAEKYRLPPRSLRLAIEKFGGNPDNGQIITSDRNEVRKHPDHFDADYLTNRALNAMHDEFGEVLRVYFWR